MIKNQFYRQIPGDFTFATPYDDIVSVMKNGDTFVEVGSLLGCSITYFTHAMMEAGKNFNVYAVDSWAGAFDEPNQANLINSLGGGDGFYNKFLEYMGEAGIDDIVIPIRRLSVEASKCFDDDSLKGIFLDAGHSYEDIKSDIAAYWPKLKNGGILAGHDYFYNNGVEKAVQEFLSANRGYVLDFKIYYLSRTWMITKSMERFD